MCECVSVCLAASEARVLDFVLGLLRQRRDLDGLLRRPLAGVEAVQRGEEAEPVGGAHGLLQVARLVQQLLDGVVALHRRALDHLDRRERRRSARPPTACSVATTSLRCLSV